jgi:chromosome segregation ATPase
MAEEQLKRPPLQEIPNRPYKTITEAVDEEGKILTLIKSIKENLDVKLTALRKDIDRQTHDEIAREISAVQEKMEKLRSNSEDSEIILKTKISGLGESLMEKIDAKLAGLKSDIDAKASNNDAVEVAQIHEELEATRTDGQLARASLLARVEGLAVKIDAIASAPAEEVARLKQSVEASLKQVQGIVSSFNLTTFVSEIRQMYSDKLSQAEAKIEVLTAQLAKLEQENEQLKKAIGDKELQLKQAGPSPPQSPQPSASTARASHPDEGQAPSGRVARVTSPRVQIYNLPPEPFANVEIQYTEPDARKKVASFCINCGKQRSNTYSQYCIFCGASFP